MYDRFRRYSAIIASVSILITVILNLLLILKLETKVNDISQTLHSWDIVVECEAQCEL